MCRFMEYLIVAYIGEVGRESETTPYHMNGVRVEDSVMGRELLNKEKMI